MKDLLALKSDFQRRLRDDESLDQFLLTVAMLSTRHHAGFGRIESSSPCHILMTQHPPQPDFQRIRDPSPRERDELARSRWSVSCWAVLPMIQKAEMINYSWMKISNGVITYPIASSSTGPPRNPRPFASRRTDSIPLVGLVLGSPSCDSER